MRVSELSAKGRIASACAAPLLEDLIDARDRAAELVVP
jgi:hypothetical protein